MAINADHHEFKLATQHLQAVIEQFLRQSKNSMTKEDKDIWQGYADNAKFVLQYLKSKEIILTGGDVQAYPRSSTGNK
jgi:hypothetical protein